MGEDEYGTETKNTNKKVELNTVAHSTGNKPELTELGKTVSVEDSNKHGAVSIGSPSQKAAKGALAQ